MSQLALKNDCILCVSASKMTTDPPILPTVRLYVTATISASTSLTSCLLLCSILASNSKPRKYVSNVQSQVTSVFSLDRKPELLISDILVLVL